MNQQTTITILVDNVHARGLVNEWGLSIHIATPRHRVLLDFGQTDAFAQNACSLGIDLASVDHAVLSHAHYDHADGMEAFFAINEHAPLHLSDACAENCWSTSANTKPLHYIGIRDGLLEQHATRLMFHPCDRATRIAQGLFVVPHTHADAIGKGQTEGMFVMEDGALAPDGFLHELTLVCEQQDGTIVVLSSCSHAGVATILAEVSAAFPTQRIAVFVGGLHLMHASDEEVLAVAQAFAAYDVERVWCGHCTSERATDLLRQVIPGRVNTLHPGLVIVL